MANSIALSGSQIRAVDVTHAPSMRRRLRRPQHPFNGQARPFEIAPIHCSPVLPGETLKNLLLQARVITDPIQNSIIGWWFETYWAYIPLRGLPSIGPGLDNMFIDTTTSATSFKAAANNALYGNFKGGVDYVKECLEVMVERYFRDEGEAWSLSVGETGYPNAAARLPKSDWTDSLKLASAGADDTELPGIDELEEQLGPLSGFATHYAQWEMMRDLNMKDITFEDYLRAAGVNIPQSQENTGDPQEDFKPELLRFTRDWTYPANTVNPTDGTVASAASWSIKERADKDRYFKEPGFLFGVALARPKIYLGNQKGLPLGHMDNVFAWLPQFLSGHPETGLKEVAFSATDGILQNQASNYWFDFADYLEFGSQFLGRGASATVPLAHAVGLPDAAMNKRFVTQGDVQDLFKADATNFVKWDGVVSTTIATTVKETT